MRIVWWKEEYRGKPPANRDVNEAAKNIVMSRGSLYRAATSAEVTLLLVNPSLRLLRRITSANTSFVVCVNSMLGSRSSKVVGVGCREPLQLL